MIRPLRDNVVVSPRDAASKTASGLYLPDVVRDKAKVIDAIVLEVGPGKVCEDGRTVVPTGLKTGDVVLYTSDVGHEITVSGEKYVILSAEDVLCVASQES